MAGINRALQSSLSLDSFHHNNGYVSEEKPCIFLSHISLDKEIVEKIANYIMYNADIDVYLDIKDDNLQRAVRDNNSKKITELIERGINESTHIMCLISDKTKNSWWVPYELGYGKKSKKEICSLKLKGEVELPSYLEIGDVLHGTKSLNAYIQKIISNSIVALNASLKGHEQYLHPLDEILDWDK